MTTSYVYDKLPGSWLGDVYAALGPSGVVASYTGGTEEAFVAYVERLVGTAPRRDPAAARQAIQEIEEYLNRDRSQFDLRLDLSTTTPFQRRVLEETARIPRGSVATYGEIARRLGKPKAARAVGQALRNNPLPLIIPCHRVIGSDGSLTGFGGSRNVEGKAALLRFEGALSV
ncbi:MAG: methylated-DNA--[protein]-cysteine S-methyltransferase [Anaerolineales bacterium]|jgi:O-6-methylguanine DNA methyltransferase